MRIISTFKDYYDCVARSGVDQSLVYLRKPKEVKVDGVAFPYQSAAHSFGPDAATVGFCDKVYSYVWYDVWANDPGIPSHEQRLLRRQVLRSAEEFDAYVRATRDKHGQARYFSKERQRWRAEPYAGLDSQRGAEKWFDEAEVRRDAHEALFHKLGAPVFIFGRSNVESNKLVFHVNAKLSDVHFEHVIGPAQAYQELSMWLASQAHPNPPIPTCSNEDMIEAKGFDLKTSFRREPGEHPKRKKKER